MPPYPEHTRDLWSNATALKIQLNCQETYTCHRELMKYDQNSPSTVKSVLDGIKVYVNPSTQMKYIEDYPFLDAMVTFVFFLQASFPFIFTW